VSFTGNNQRKIAMLKTINEVIEDLQSRLELEKHMANPTKVFAKVWGNSDCSFDTLKPSGGDLNLKKLLDSFDSALRTIRYLASGVSDDEGISHEADMTLYSLKKIVSEQQTAISDAKILIDNESIYIKGGNYSADEITLFLAMALAKKDKDYQKELHEYVFERARYSDQLLEKDLIKINGKVRVKKEPKPKRLGRIPLALAKKGECK
jgi:hypothetical protein